MQSLDGFTRGVAAAAPLLVVTLAAPPAMAQGVALEPIEELGKLFFFDTRLSTPRNKQGCVSCHNPAIGWAFPDPSVNQTQVVAPGAQPGELGTMKTPSNAYAPDFAFLNDGGGPPQWRGGNFWNARAEGCGADTNDPNCPIGANATETITPDDVGLDCSPPPPEDPDEFCQYLGPIADQALNPTFRPGVEQNTREKNVCQLVKAGPYKDLYDEVWGPIDCSQQGVPPEYHLTFKKLAVSVAAWQMSPDVNSQTSPRDDCLRLAGLLTPADAVAYLDAFAEDERAQESSDVFEGCLTEVERRGHDIFYGLETDANVAGTSPGCHTCHNSFEAADGADPSDDFGLFLANAYTDAGFHNLGVPYNSEIPTTEYREIRGLADHVENEAEGSFKTPTVRNVGKGDGGPTPLDREGLAQKSRKAYMRNGYLKSLEQVTHWYNTARIKPDCAPGIEDATAEEAILNDCWPAAEFPGFIPPFVGLVGDLGLTCPENYSDVLDDEGQDICTVPPGEVSEEEALVAYMRALTDSYTPTAPSMSRNPNN